jgi:hypothetical protein
MLKNIINGVSTSEIYKLGNTDMNRGTLLVKDYTNKVANKADAVAVETYFLDFDSQPTGHLSDVEVSQYDSSMDTVKANTYAVLKKLVSGTWATDQVIATDLSAGDYLYGGTDANIGKLVKAVSTNVTPYRYVGTYDDCGHTLFMFEIVEPKTIA